MFNWNYFLPRAFLTLISNNGWSHKNTYQGTQNWPREKGLGYTYVTLFYKFLKLYVSQTKENFLNTYTFHFLQKVTTQILSLNLPFE